MAMAFSCSSFCKSRIPYFPCRLKVQLLPQARSQNSRDEGNSRNTVDANMSVLRSRIERMKMKERLNTYYYKVEEKNGWNYRSQYDDVNKIHNFLATSFQLAHIVCTTIALVFLTGSLSIFLLSFIFSPSIN